MTRWVIDGAEYEIAPQSRSWSVGDAVVFKVRRPRWRPEQHPRNRRGQFVEVGDPVTLLGGTRGSFQGVDARSGRLRIRVGDSERLVQRSHVTFNDRAAAERATAPAKPKPAPKPAAKPAQPVPSVPGLPAQPLPPSPVISTPGEPDRAKPDMAASQRKAINELNIDDPALMYGMSAQQGAKLLRDNKPMTASQAAALAAVVRARAQDPGIPKPKRNSMAKGAEWLDTVVAQLNGFKPSQIPDPGTSKKIEIDAVKAGDIIALPNASGKAEIRTVVEAKPWYGVHKFTLKNGAGATEERFVAPGTPLYVFNAADGLSGATKVHDDGKPGIDEPKALYDALPTPPKLPQTPPPPKVPEQPLPPPPKLPEAAPPPPKVPDVEPDQGISNGPGAVTPNVPWYDQIALGAGANMAPIPVTDLTVESYTVKHGVAWRVNGMSFLVELKPGETEAQAKARGEKSASMLGSVLEQAPPEKRALQRGLALLQGSNPADSYWEQKYKIPGFHSKATGGFGTTHVWGGHDPKPTDFAHEFGHTVDSQAFGTDVWLSDADGPVVPGQEMSWKDAQAIDQDVSLFYANRFKESAGLNPSASYTFYKPITVGEPGVTSYGTVDRREDFAESVRLWMKQRREGHIGTDTESGEKIHFSDLFPERAKILDAVMGTKTDFNTPARKRRMKSLQDQFLENFKDNDKDPSFPLDNPNDWGSDVTGLTKADIKAAHVNALEAFAQWKKDQAAAKKAKEAAEKLAAEKAAAMAKAMAEVESVTKALGAGKLEQADAKKFRLKVTLYKNKLRDQGYSETEIAQMAAAYETELMHEHFKLGKFAMPKLSPKFSEKERAAAHAWFNEGGLTQHPLAKQQYGKDDQAEANIAAELGDRLNNPIDWEHFRNSKNAKPGEPPVGSFESYSSADRHALLAAEVSKRVGVWAGTSGDSNESAVLMQEAAKQEFGLPPEANSAPRMEQSQFDNLMQNRWPTDGPWYQRVTRVMYEHTQEEFKKAGITHVSLYRGMKFFSGYSRPDWSKTSGTKRVPLQPINSWSTSKGTSQGFSHGVMLKASVPVELILSAGRTGLGTMYEYEFVVFDNEGEMDVKVT